MRSTFRLLRNAQSLLGCIAALVVLGGLASIATAQGPVPDVLWYQFGPTDNVTMVGGIHDSTANHYDGTVATPSEAELGQPYHLGGTKAIHLDGDDAIEFGKSWGSGIATFQSADTLGINGVGANYTAMAWVNFDIVSGKDQMIFGQSSGDMLHLGLRGNHPYQGHWGNDTGGNTTVSAGTWYHFAFRYDGTTQSIFVNGALDKAENHGPLHNGGNVIVGRTVGNNGALGGFLDDARIYGTALSDGDIAAIGTPP